MGCDTSKSDNGDGQEKQEAEEEFTENQVDSIKSTWPILASDPNKTGSKLFRLIFTAEPKIKQLFMQKRNRYIINDGANGDKDEENEEEDLVQDPAMQEHIHNFMQTLGNVVDTFDLDKKSCEQTLMLLGAKHAMLDGFTEDYFSVYSNCILDTWESVIGEEYIVEVKESWEVLCTFLTRFMREGFVIYQQESVSNTSDNEVAI